MHKHFVAYLAYGPLLEKFPVKFDHLKEICFSIDLADLEAAALALPLFQNSPKLKILDIRFIFGDNSVSGGPDFWEPIDREDYSFEHLQTVTIHNFLPSRPMFSFVRFVLSAAPNLNELTMSKENSDGVVDPTTFKQLLRFKRASANDEIIFVSATNLVMHTVS
ncbi:F-box/FBD-like domains containing protein [Rhynchospora pubera]|uniref:F-box/FBD-like domains containing protein n=1 Tax=Rhynchospora pubera TaxID=906938 RepID=A0AAV8EGC4_9POAL|nr:F-box/FBD-like domains containing protein [Rhynchospora pubera]